MNSREGDVNRGRRLHCLPLQLTVDDKEQLTTASHCPAVRHHRRQRSISFDA